ncbi:PREDICTED: aldehyde oxidase GLOX1-like [Ipomoea nil]|uniref:aldehyde oxidase GLOX1-like n=1 Tax=Ipomoea nil TaxID=35883 RepID=UPI000901A439|nr:PREDICTED: aldehyde oxidase GLOX1-like [Ipomoea nil]
MYHSTSAVLPDAKILVAGSNTHDSYDMKAKYPTDMRVEKFSPPYLAPALQKFRPQIVEKLSQTELVYGKNFNIHFKLDDAADMSSIKVTMYPPPFTTHGYSEGQRMLILGLTSVAKETISAVAPSSGKLAPPGYYLIFVVHRGVPSKGLVLRDNELELLEMAETHRISPNQASRQKFNDPCGQDVINS